MGRMFSVEMKSKNHVKGISVSNEAHDRVLFEGDLGVLEELVMVEEVMLEVRGTNGVLRVELSREELLNVLRTERLYNPSAEVGRYTSTNNNRRMKNG